MTRVQRHIPTEVFCLSVRQALKMNGGPLLGFCMDPRESKDSCCYLLVTFKVKESTIYFKGYRIFRLLNRGGLLQEAAHTDGRRAQEGGT